MRYNLHIFFTVKIQKFTPYAPFLPPCFYFKQNTVFDNNQKMKRIYY